MTSNHSTHDRADIDALKADQYLLMAELAASGAKPREKGHFPCPFHNEKSASCHIKEENGTWFFKCFGCGKGGDIITAYAIRNRIDNRVATSELLKEFRRNPRKAPPPTAAKPPRVYRTTEELEKQIISAITYHQRDKKPVTQIAITNKYEYVSLENRLELIVYRIEYYVEGDVQRHKQFIQCHPVDDGWVMRKPPGKMPLYNRKGIEKSSWVCYCEGEKACEALMQLGFPATTNPGGSNAPVEDIDLSPLEGKKVYVWPDYDPINPKTGVRGGFEHMKRIIAAALQLQVMPDMFWCDPENAGLGEKEDAYDFIQQNLGQSREDQQRAINVFLSTGKICGDAELIDRYLDQVFSGQLRPINMPWPKLQDMTRALIPGKIMIVCGAAGATKSLMGLQLMIHVLFEEKKRVAILMLEDSKEEHLMRGLAIWCRIGPLTRAEWCEQHEDVVRTHQKEQYRFLNELGRALEVRSDTTIPPEMILDFIQRHAKAGARIIYIDPVTMMEVGDKQWVADLSFLIKAKAICTEYGVVLILVTHPKKGSNFKKSMDDMAGGQSYVRFSHSILWLEALSESEHAEFRPFIGPTVSKEYNRLGWVIKARNSYGAGKAVGFYFDGSTFEAEECGQLIEEKKDEKDKKS